MLLLLLLLGDRAAAARLVAGGASLHGRRPRRECRLLQSRACKNFAGTRLKFAGASQNAVSSRTPPLALPETCKVF